MRYICLRFTYILNWIICRLCRATVVSDERNESLAFNKRCEHSESVTHCWTNLMADDTLQTMLLSIGWHHTPSSPPLLVCCCACLQVAEAVFKFLSMLCRAGPQKYIFDEIKTIEDNEFRFQDPVSQFIHVVMLCVIATFCCCTLWPSHAGVPEAFSYLYWWRRLWTEL